MTKTLPRDFWCDDCRAWTPVAGTAKDFWCGRCGEPYHCGECGYEIDRAGNCQRPTVRTLTDTPADFYSDPNRTEFGD